MNKKNKWISLFIYTCIILFWLCIGISTGEVVDRIVAVVNDDIILLSDLDQSLTVVQATLDRQKYPNSEQERIIKEQRQKILKQLIYDKLTDQQVQKLNLKVDDDEVDATIERIRSTNKLSEKELIRAIELDGMTYEIYRTRIKEQMLRARLVNRQVKSKIAITDKDVKSYYDAYPDKYGYSTKYNLRHILLKTATNEDPDKKKQIFDNINAIRKRLIAGASFEEMAKRFSEAPTASQGGGLGVFATHLLTSEIRIALKGLQAKQMSEVVETEQGYQIFYVEDIVNTGGKTLSEASDEIREQLYADVVDKKFNAWIEDLRKKSHIQILDE